MNPCYDAHNKLSIFTERGQELSISDQSLKGLLMSVLDKGAAFRFQAKGFSMSPFIKDGDVVTVLPLTNHSPRLGDSVVFIDPVTDKLVLHRVVGRRDGSGFLIKGDNLPNIDSLVPKAYILGSVRRVERGGKKISIGLGPEKALIAFLSRWRLLLPLLIPVWRIIRPIIWKFVR